MDNLPQLSSKFQPGEHILVCNTIRAIVVTQEDFERFTDDSTLTEFKELTMLPWENGKVFFRWDPSGIYDWHWEMYCKLLPSSELAKEACVNETKTT